MPTNRRYSKRMRVDPNAVPDELGLFIRAQQWLNATFQDRLAGKDVPIPKELRDYFGWRQGEKTIFTEAEVEAAGGIRGLDDDAIARELLADVCIDNAH